jgi:hypothetical protein
MRARRMSMQNRTDASGVDSALSRVQQLVLGHGLDAAAQGINWCESDYAVTPSIAEWWNTISNVAFLVPPPPPPSPPLAKCCRIIAAATERVPQVAGCKCLAHSRSLHLPLAFSLNAAFILLTAVASALFHATLLLRWQRVDETFENMILIFMLRGSDSSVRPALLHAAAATAGIVFASCILFCEVHLVGMAIANILKLRRLCLPMRALTPPPPPPPLP